MAFTSASFIVLTIASVLLYYIVPKKAQWCILLLASAAFYMAGSVKAFAWVVLVSGMTWVTGLILGRYNAIKPADKAQKAQIQHKKKQIAIICAVCCFGLLYAMKYWNFTLELLPSALSNHIPRWDFVVPLGLSFFIFQSMSYVIDVYRGKYAPERNPLRYGLFVSFFPQMVQGPISRFDQLAPQLTAERKLCWDDLQIGIQLALWGYFKKIVIADRAAVLVNNVIMENCPYGGAIIALGILFYCIQLYCDFSGGIDITRGVARMFGINMTLNFRRPLFSTSLTDYWRRWHITLGAWMRDYVFYPLAFSKPFGKLGKWARKHFKGMMGKICATSTATSARSDWCLSAVISPVHRVSRLYSRCSERPCCTRISVSLRRLCRRLDWIFPTLSSFLSAFSSFTAWSSLRNAARMCRRGSTSARRSCS